MKRFKISMLLAIACLGTCLTGCDDALVASRNLSKAADNFEVYRRVIYYNGITDTYIMTLEGFCSIYDNSDQLEVTCKDGEDDFSKHFLGLSDNATYFVEQMAGVDVSVYHHRVTFKPQVIIPDVNVRVDEEELSTDRY